MEFKIIEEKNNWDKFLFENRGNFLQSFEWGEFQKKFFPGVKRIEIWDKDKKILSAQIIAKKFFSRAPFAFFYIPYGPTFNLDSLPEQREEAFNIFLKGVKKMALKEKGLFLRIEPFIPLPKIKNFYFRNSLKRSQPQKTSILGLDEEEKKLLADTNIRTRYNINLARRKGVKITILDSYEHIFYSLLERTRKRQGFTPYSEEYYKKMFEAQGRELGIKMFLAKYQDKAIVAGIFVFFGNRAVSLHAGSDYRYRSLKGMNLLHWRAICYAKKQGYKAYDFWGIDEKKYPGVTKFKKGFRGKEIKYPFGVDIIFDKMGYQIYKIIRSAKHLF